MGLDVNDVQLDDGQKRRLEEFSRRNGKSASAIIRAAIDEYLAAHSTPECSAHETCYELAQRAGLTGTFEDAPPDLSTNRDYFQGFGRE